MRTFVLAALLGASAFAIKITAGDNDQTDNSFEKTSEGDFYDKGENDKVDVVSDIDDTFTTDEQGTVLNGDIREDDTEFTKDDGVKGFGYQAVTDSDVLNIGALARQFMNQFDADGDEELTRNETKDIRDYIMNTYGTDIWTYSVLQHHQIEDILQKLAESRGVVGDFNISSRFFSLSTGSTDVSEDYDAEGNEIFVEDDRERHELSKAEAYRTAEELLRIAIYADMDYDGILSTDELESFESDSESTKLANTKQILTDYGNDLQDQEVSIEDVLQVMENLLVVDRINHSQIELAPNGDTMRLELFFNVLDSQTKGKLDSDDGKGDYVFDKQRDPVQTI